MYGSSGELRLFGQRSRYRSEGFDITIVGGGGGLCRRSRYLPSSNLLVLWARVTGGLAWDGTRD